jgi:hypothetical protein
VKQIHLGNDPITIGGSGRYTGVPEVVCLIPQGDPVTVWRWEMPRIDDQLLDCVIYLYPSVASAQRGETAGGTGFLVGVPSEQHKEIVYIYAVTNSHVIREGQSPVIRFNAMRGDHAVLPLPEANWVHHPDGDDIAVSHLGGLNPSILRFRLIPAIMLLTVETIRQQDIGPGDDVFMVGRFVSHDGHQRNLPSVRFGNISMMTGEKIQHPRQLKVESFLVEMRSVPGYSGSPVFVRIESSVRRPGDKALLTIGRATGPWLLGVDWGHIGGFEKVKQQDRETDSSEGYVVKSNTGQMAVAPAWKLRELLHADEFIEMRRKGDELTAADKAKNPIELDAAKALGKSDK